MLPRVNPGDEEQFRAAAFAYLERLAARSGGLVRRQDLEAFVFDGRRIPLVSRQRGIWRPAGFRAAVSILTTFAPNPERRPYDDAIGPDGYPRYKWQGSDPSAWDNVSLRRAMEARTPLIWFVGVAPGSFDPLFPVWLVREEPESQQFVVALDDVMRAQWSADLALATGFEPTRRYAEVTVRARLHQRVFRGQVLLAYQSQCALCRLRHPELLDAAHIRSDADGGQPIVPNGLAMCAIHHRSFDANLLAVRPDFTIELRADVLEETDGPTLRHALQGLHGELIALPRRRAERPSVELLEERYERFRAAG
jgi:putative restriction endonuclease